MPTEIAVDKACADCGEDPEPYDQHPYVDTDRDNAPICRECYERWKEDQECPTCGRSGSCSC